MTIKKKKTHVILFLKKFVYKFWFQSIIPSFYEHEFSAPEKVEYSEIVKMFKNVWKLFIWVFRSVFRCFGSDNSTWMLQEEKAWKSFVQNGNSKMSLPQWTDPFSSLTPILLKTYNQYEDETQGKECVLFKATYARYTGSFEVSIFEISCKSHWKRSLNLKSHTEQQRGLHNLLSRIIFV